MSRAVSIILEIFKNDQLIAQYQVQIDTQTQLRELFEFVQQNLAITDANPSQWTCFSKELNCYLNDQNSTFQFDQTLVINIDNKKKIKVISSGLVRVSIKIIVSNGVTPLLEKQLNLEPKTTLTQLYSIVSTELDIKDNINSWTCFSTLTRQYLQEQIIGQQYQNDTFQITVPNQRSSISHNTKQQQGNKIKVKLIIQKNTDIVAEKAVDSDQTAIVQQVFDYVGSSMGIVGKNSFWTCYSQNRQQFLTDRVSRIVIDDTLIINIADDVKYYSSIHPQRECPIHRNQQIQSICIAKHNCQKRLCVLCEHDDQHQYLKKSDTLPLPIAIGNLQTKIKPLISQQQQCDQFMKKVQLVKESFLKYLDQYIESLQDISQLYQNSFIKVNEILKYMEQGTLFESTNTFVGEIVDLLNSNQIESQILISKINFETIENNVNNLVSLFEQFETNMNQLKFIKVSQKEWYFIIIDSQINTVYQFIQFQDSSFRNGLENNRNIIILQEKTPADEESVMFPVFRPK